VYPLQPATPSAKQKDEYHDQQQEANAAAAVVAHSRPHIVAAAAKEQQENDQDEYDPHGGESNTQHRRRFVCSPTRVWPSAVHRVRLLIARAVMSLDPCAPRGTQARRWQRC
jgi:hypothetical protein